MIYAIVELIDQNSCVLIHTFISQYINDQIYVSIFPLPFFIIVV